MPLSEVATGKFYSRNLVFYVWLEPHSQLDGLDQSEALKHGREVRSDVLLELFTSQESHDGSESVAYREDQSYGS